MSGRARPDFFVVGAPKCGTTSLYRYLDAHPDVYMSTVKEPYHFCPDLRIGLPRIEDREDYLALFRDAGNARRAGEASVWYLYSREAARLIRDFNPDARIVILLRSPVDMIYSLYNHYRYSGAESIGRFEEALAAEPDRKRGLRLPPRRKAGEMRETLYYSEVGRYAGQVERYLDAFGRERVHVMLFDDLRDRTDWAYGGVLEFLGVDSRFRPDFAIENARRQPRSASLHSLLSAPLPGPVRPITRRLPALGRIRTWLKRGNTRFGTGVPMAQATRRTLERGFQADVEKLERLLGRDLGAWRGPAVEPA